MRRPQAGQREPWRPGKHQHGPYSADLTCGRRFCCPIRFPIIWNGFTVLVIKCYCDVPGRRVSAYGKEKRRG